MTRSTIFRLVIGGSALLLAVVVYGFWYSAVVSGSAKAAELSVEIETNGARASRVAAAKEALATLSGDEATIGQYFISSGSLVPFLESLQTTGKQLGATVTVSSVSASAKGDRPVLSVNGTVVGSFDAVMRFIGSVEYAPYYTTLEQLSLTNGSGPGAVNAQSADWTATFVLTVGSETPITTDTPNTPVQPTRTTPSVAPTGTGPRPQS